MAEALYVALVTDTGKFQYENTTPTSHLMAAELLEHGVDVHGIFAGCSRTFPSPSCSCWRACCRASSATTTGG